MADKGFLTRVGSFFGLVTEEVPAQGGYQEDAPSHVQRSSKDRPYERTAPYAAQESDEPRLRSSFEQRSEYAPLPYTQSTYQGGKILNHPSVSQAPAQRLDFKKIEHFQDVYEIIDLLLEGVVVDINTEMLRGADAQRVLDALSGSAYALDGRLRRTGQNVYQLAPSSVVVNGSYDDDRPEPRASSGGMFRRND